MVQFAKATKKRARARVGLLGPAGSGKTFTALVIAKELAEGGEIFVVDSEHESASKYADIFEFQTHCPTSFAPRTCVEAIKAAEKAGAAVIVLDSLTHYWSGKDGALEQVDKAAARSQSKNSYMAWRDVTPMHNEMIDAILQSPCHIVATMRTKTEYILEDVGNGKKMPRKIGMAPIQRDGMEYEFDVVGDLDQENRLVVTKTRCPQLSGGVFLKPDASFARIISDWLKDGVEEPKSSAGFGIDMKASASAQIANVTVPGLLLALLATWEATYPIASRPDWWEKVHKAAVDKYSKMGWDDGELVDRLNAIQGEIDKTKVAAPAL